MVAKQGCRAPRGGGRFRERGPVRWGSMWSTQGLGFHGTEWPCCPASRGDSGSSSREVSRPNGFWKVPRLGLPVGLGMERKGLGTDAPSVCAWGPNRSCSYVHVHSCVSTRITRTHMPIACFLSRSPCSLNSRPSQIRDRPWMWRGGRGGSCWLAQALRGFDGGWLRGTGLARVRGRVSRKAGVEPLGKSGQADGRPGGQQEASRAPYYCRAACAAAGPGLRSPGVSTSSHLSRTELRRLEKSMSWRRRCETLRDARRWRPVTAALPRTPAPRGEVLGLPGASSPPAGDRRPLRCPLPGLLRLEPRCWSAHRLPEDASPVAQRQLAQRGRRRCAALPSTPTPAVLPGAPGPTRCRR